VVGQMDSFSHSKIPGKDPSMNHQEVFNDAVKIVSEELSPESAKIIRYAIQNNKTESFKVENGLFGISFRNLLAERGIIWEEAILHTVWLAVLQQAVMKILE
jgi:hypothetical protein